MAQLDLAGLQLCWVLDILKIATSLWINQTVLDPAVYRMASERIQNGPIAHQRTVQVVFSLGAHTGFDHLNWNDAEMTLGGHRGVQRLFSALSSCLDSN